MSTKVKRGAKSPGIRVTGLACSFMWVMKTEFSSFVTVESVLKPLNHLSNPSLLLLKIMSLLSTLVFMATCFLHRIINVQQDRCWLSYLLLSLNCVFYEGKILSFVYPGSHYNNWKMRHVQCELKIESTL